MNFEEKLKILPGIQAALDFLQYLMGTFAV